MDSEEQTSEPTVVYEGWIAEYWEQGWEGNFWRIFQDARFCASRTEGWSPAGIIRLEDGQHLTVFDDAGVILWSGRLQARQLSRCERHHTQPWQPGWHPVGVPDETWAAWFNAHPALRARLQS